MWTREPSSEVRGAGATSLSGYWYERVSRTDVVGDRRESVMVPWPGRDVDGKSGFWEDMPVDLEVSLV